MSYSVDEDIKIYVQAKYPIIYILSWEEERVLDSIKSIAKNLSKNIFVWDCVNGLNKIDSLFPNKVLNTDPYDAFESLIKGEDNSIYVFKDLHPYFNDYRVIRKLRNMLNIISKSKKSFIIISPILNIPTELEKDTVVVDYPLPDIHVLNETLDDIYRLAEKNENIKINLNNIEKEKLLKAAIGLTKTEADNIFAKALVVNNVIDIKDLEIILEEKKQVIRKSGILEYYEVDEHIKNIGGLDLLKKWIQKRVDVFSDKARNFGLPEPKGILLLGVQGCGKSLAAKASASVWKLPLLRLDIGAIFGKYIGESEMNMRKVIKIAESISPVILWIDEIEKGFSGLSGSQDSGTSSRVFGSFLTWMQEKTKPVFIFATANNISLLPPELLRKGRFDEIFFVDLPNTLERKEIFEIHLKKRNKNNLLMYSDVFANTSEGFSGAEIEQVIISSLFDAFDLNRELNKEDVINNITRTRPLSVTMKEKITELRNWAKDRTVFATSNY